ncbi:MULTISPECIES: BlaI/MecI/CopY family transcriptional regulator [Aeromicrobium]|uniref:BlaI/MecI/CopY family transcriptional regulator n=1 Tax=Aeromicrobium TaxID=2040 RepID=UPI000B3E9039|nr:MULTISPECIES: BlaI/MecI/CopY family transcriptional regulator [Aeromicrobium]OUZ06646.1 hypothetical protein BHE97_18690 [Aeromicrobium sp. PE09-221]
MGPLETSVMQRLWAVEQPQTVREVQEFIAADRTIAYTTVMTVLDNLHGKGFVTRERQGRAYVYSPRETREEYTASLLGNALADGGDRRGVLMHFVDRLDEEALASLRQLLQEPGNDPEGVP